ncbi:MAG TPA: acyltransferase [Baekduia sp.]|nr:acyltransferase [Baekduia sp.]
MAQRSSLRSPETALPAAGRDRAQAGARRIPELDAVRGLAALCVVLGHFTLALPAVADASRADGLTPWNVALYSPLHAVFAGGAAVIVFFVLSGFVLTVSYEHGRQTFAGFVVRRAARIWLPYLVAITAGMILAALLGRGLVPGASSWLDDRWQQSPTLVPVVQHLSLIGHMRDDAQYVPVIWSLTDEMRISLIFPLLLAATVALGWWRSLAAGIVTTAVGLAAASRVSADFATLEYLLCFVAGALLAHHRGPVRDTLMAAGAGRRRALFAAALLLFTWDSWLPPAWAPGRLDSIVQSESTHVVLETAAAGAFIALAQVPGPVHRLLRSAVPQHLGRISYSLYLVHTIVLLAVLHLLGDAIALPWLLAPAAALSLVLADVGQRYVERPAQQLGRRVAGRLEQAERSDRVVLAG